MLVNDSTETRQTSSHWLAKWWTDTLAHEARQKFLKEHITADELKSQKEMKERYRDNNWCYL